MMKNNRIWLVPSLIAGMWVNVATSSSSATLELITNGDFETGSLLGWETGVQADSNVDAGFQVASSNFTPVSNAATTGPAAGTFYAVSDQAGPSAQFLTQQFVVPAGDASVTLSFGLFVNDSNPSSTNPIIDESGLDFTSAGTNRPNQHARVDLLLDNASALDTDAGVLQNFFIGSDPQGTNPNPYTHFVFDITALVAGGGTFDLRFAAVDNQGTLNQGLDNVSVQFTPVPEPTTVLASGLALGCGVLLRRRKQRSSRSTRCHSDDS